MSSSKGRPTALWSVAAAALAVLPALSETTAAAHLHQDGLWLSTRVGLWSLEHRAIPRTALFTQFPAEPWASSSLGLDLLRAVAYRMERWAGLEILQLLLLTLLAICVFGALYALVRRPALALLLSLPALWLAASDSLSPALFALELALLLSALRRASSRPLRWLPAIFLLWANLDASFLIGLALLLWFAMAVLAEEILRPANPGRLTAAAVLPALALSLVAGAISPYGPGNYRPILWAITGHAYRYQAGLHAPLFRSASDFASLAVLLFGFFALGRMRTRSLFLWSSMLAAAALSCCMQDFRWSGVMFALALLALALRPTGDDEQSPASFRELLPGLLTLATLLTGLCLFVSAKQESLAHEVETRYPAAACRFLAQQGASGAIFNEYSWGDYAVFALPHAAVSIDSRAALYGDDRNLAFLGVLNGQLPVEQLDSFRRSSWLLLRTQSRLASEMRRRPDCREVYSDDIAAVFWHEVSR